MYEILLKACLTYKVDIANCGRIEIYKSTRHCSYISQKNIVFKGEQLVVAFIKNRYISCSCCDKLFKTELIKHIRFPEGRFSEDIPYVFEAIYKAQKIVCIKDVFYFYYHRENSSSTKAFSIRRMDYYYLKEM